MVVARPRPWWSLLCERDIRGERVAAIVPESVLDALRAAKDAEDAAEADAAMHEPGASDLRSWTPADSPDAAL